MNQKGHRMLFNKIRNNGINRLLFMLFCMIMFIFGIAANSPADIPNFQTQETPDAASAQETVEENLTATITATETITPTTTPFPDWAMTSKDTNGLLVAGILILFIIIVGTLTAMTKNFSLPQKKE